MLWQTKDVGLLTHFVQGIQDPAEKQRAWQRYHAIRRFAEGGQCRCRQICLHFGETPKWDRCEACDVCGVEPEWMNEAAAPQPAVRRKLVSPVEARPVDDKLRDALREWRRKLAKTLSLPAYIILHDSTVDALCVHAPSTIAELCEVPGIGEKKAERFGKEILEVIDSHRREHTTVNGPRQ
jgi:ATP-dependent DNA helicase RecQ